MALVLLWVWLDLRRGSAEGPVARFDFTNPILGTTAGACVAVGPDVLRVLPPGPVRRPASGPAKLPGYTSDPRAARPYVACERLPSIETQPAGAPATAHETLLFALNDFGMPDGTVVGLESIEPEEGVKWGGRTRSGWLVVLRRYDALEGPWKVHVSKDAPVLGTMRREFFSANLPQSQTFAIPEGCR
jgi:hypothetical protein